MVIVESTPFFEMHGFSVGDTVTIVRRYKQHDDLVWVRNSSEYEVIMSRKRLGAEGQDKYREAIL